MKAAAAILLLVSGLGAGWFLRGTTVEEHDPARVERSDTQVARLHPPEADSAPGELAEGDNGSVEAKEPQSNLIGGNAADELAAPAAETEETKEEANPFAQMMKGMLGKKGF